MALDQVGICNLALVRVGADRISSITQSTRSASLLNASWEAAVKATLRSGRWNFATKRVVLAPRSDAPAWGYDYQYDLPNDYVAFFEVDDLDIEFILEDGLVLTDESSLNAKYVYYNTDVSSWDASFCDAMAWKLAELVSYALTQSLSLAQACAKAFENSIGGARTSDGQEGTPPQIEISGWTDVRG